MKHVSYSCDECNEPILGEIHEARKRGVIALNLAGMLSKDDSWTKMTEKEFCNTTCLAQYLARFSKELIAQQVIDQ